ncbi:MAG: ferredoxin reductase [Leifsonia sp.]
MSGAADTAWRVGTVSAIDPETPSAKRITLDVEGWPGNIAGQHLDVRLTAPDGYSATRSYSIASAGPGTTVDLAVDKLPSGEVSPFLVDELMVGDRLEIHGPLGGWFVWEPDSAPGRPVQLIGGGSGVVPLVAMIRSHLAAEDATPFRLLYSVRTPDDVFFSDVLAEDTGLPGLRVDLIYTRRAPDGWPVTPARITREVVESSVFSASENPRIYLCGSTVFVETVAGWLTDLGHDPRSIRTERFGGTS